MRAENSPADAGDAGRYAVAAPSSLAAAAAHELSAGALDPWLAVASAGHNARPVPRSALVRLVGRRLTAPERLAWTGQGEQLVRLAVAVRRAMQLAQLAGPLDRATLDSQHIAAALMQSELADLLDAFTETLRPERIRLRRDEALLLSCVQTEVRQLLAAGTVYGRWLTHAAPELVWPWALVSE